MKLLIMQCVVNEDRPSSCYVIGYKDQEERV
jgi:hypothetical protein